MKLIDDKGRIFGKIHILDLLFILAVILIIFSSIAKILNRSVLDITTPQEYRDVEVEVVVNEDEGYLNIIKIGDILGEKRKYLDGEIISVEVDDVEERNLDENSNEIVSIDPTKEKANIVFTARVNYKDLNYMLGDQELREGKFIFLESDLYRLRAQIVNMKVVD